MIKKITNFLASTLLFIPNVFAERSEVQSRTVKLSPEFLSSLDEEQTHYLKEQLKKAYAPLIDDNSGYLYIDMEEVEMAELAEDPTTQTFPERR